MTTWSFRASIVVIIVDQSNLRGKGLLLTLSCNYITEGSLGSDSSRTRTRIQELKHKQWWIATYCPVFSKPAFIVPVATFSVWHQPQ